MPVKEGQAYRQTDKWLIVKTLDLSGIGSNLDFHTLKFNEFIRLVNSHKAFVHEFLGIKTQVEYVRNITAVKFRQLAPSYRFKRGLLNPLGSLIKVVSGNLDNEDAIRYDSLFAQIHSKEMATDKRITLITRMLDNFVNSTETLQENIINLDKRFKVIEELIKLQNFKENTCLYLTYVSSMFDMFISMFRTIYVELNEIETALAFSKVSVLHQSIINSTELLLLLKEIENVNHLVYKVTESNLLKLEKVIAVKAYVKVNQITFILEVPLIDKNSYDYFKIYSLPIFQSSLNKTVVVFPEFPYLLAKDSKYLPVSKPCQKIAEENKFLCYENDMLQFPILTCAEQLLEFQSDPTLCVPYAVDIEEIKVQRIGLDAWIIFTQKPTVLVEKCHNENNRESLHGTFILTTSENCEVHLDELKLNYNKLFAGNLQYKITPMVSFPRLKSTNITSMAKVNIKNIDLEEVKQFSRILKLKESEISESESEIRVVNTQSVSLGTILLYLILIILVIGFISYRYVFKRNDRIKAIVRPDNFALEGGGVMHPVGREILTPNA